MNKELVHRLASEAGMPVMQFQAGRTVFCISLEQQAAFAALVAEECAAICETRLSTADTPDDCARDIRERFKP